jgi:hypothetical protein
MPVQGKYIDNRPEYCVLVFIQRIAYNHCRSPATVTGREAIEEISG